MARMIDEEAIAEIHFKLVAGVADFGDTRAIGQHAQSAADRGPVGEEWHRFADEPQTQGLHRNVAVHFRTHSEIAARDDDVAGT